MKRNYKPYSIQCNWDSEYLCKNCGELLYYDIETNEIHCFNSQCKAYAADIDIFSTDEVDLTLLYQQLSEREAMLGQMIKTCDYDSLVWFLLERRRRIVQRIFSTQHVLIEQFLLSNEILLFIKKYKSPLGIRTDPSIFMAILRLYRREYSNILNLLEDLKEGRYLLARNPLNRIFKLKYFDIVENEIWASYGHVNLQSTIDVDKFRYHEVIQKIVSSQDETSSIETRIKDFAPYFDRLWPFQVSFQFLVRRNYSTSLKYQYPVTPTDLANILSIIVSLKDDELTAIPQMNLLQHLIRQPFRDKNINEFINMLSGYNDKIPIVIKTNGSIILDRRTLLLFCILMHSQHLPSGSIISGQQHVAQFKKEAGYDFENYIISKLESIGYHCLPPSTRIAGSEYDVIASSESNQDILLIEAKFKDPSPSSFSADKLIEQEFTFEKYGLLPQVIKHKNRYDLLFQRPDLFQQKLGLKSDIHNYNVRPFIITKYTPLISAYGDVHVMSEKDFFDKLSPIK